MVSKWRSGRTGSHSPCRRDRRNAAPGLRWWRSGRARRSILARPGAQRRNHGGRRILGQQRQVVPSVAALPGQCREPPDRLDHGRLLESRHRRIGGLTEAFRRAGRQGLQPDPQRGDAARGVPLQMRQVGAKLRHLGGGGLATRARGGRGLGDEPQRVAHAIEPPPRKDRVIDQREQPSAQRQQMAGEVPAVHRRNVARRQRLQGLGVVPVVEMPAVPLQASHRGERIGAALDERARRDVAEVVGGQIRQQRQADVGRRSAVGDRRDAILLVVVRGQPVVRRRTK